MIEDRPDDWRETMPLWAHLAWWKMQENLPFFRAFDLVSFVPDDDFSDGGFVVIRLKWKGVPAEHRTTYRYLPRF